MVISDSFIWLHIPKTAGDATLLMFEELQHPWRLLDRHTDPRKHGTIADAHARVPDSRSFAVIANLRRLPEVALSYFHHMQRHAPNEPFANGRRWGDLEFSEYIRWVIDHPKTQSYDWILDNHLGDRDADHWLRASSSLASSFIDVIGRHVEIPETTRERIHTLSANVGPYAKKSLDAWYAREEVEALYANCPRWAATESRVYGDLPLDTEIR
jgi:hypothetical protein